MAQAARRPVVKLMLDEMYPPTIAEQLRDRGHDVEAVVEHDELSGLPDPDLFAEAQRAGRAVVTENAPDFILLHNECLALGLEHHGVILTSNAKFPRGAPGTVGELVTALAELLDDPPPLQPPDGWLWWL